MLSALSFSGRSNVMVRSPSSCGSRSTRRYSKSGIVQVNHPSPVAAQHRSCDDHAVSGSPPVNPDVLSVRGGERPGESPGVAALELRGVSKSFRQGGDEVRVLDQVDLSIGPGEFCSLVGPSGSGKSTLLHLAGGIDEPDAGEVLVNGV